MHLEKCLEIGIIKKNKKEAAMIKNSLSINTSYGILMSHKELIIGNPSAVRV